MQSLPKQHTLTAVKSTGNVLLLIMSKLITSAAYTIKMVNPTWQLKEILFSLNLSNKVYEEWHPAALGVMNANKKLGLKGGFKRF